MICPTCSPRMVACRAVLPGMLGPASRARSSPRLHRAGEYGSIRPAAAYAAAKGGIIAFTKSLAREVAARSASGSSAISPGPINTPALQALA